jgi:hypothetical protein
MRLILLASLLFGSLASANQNFLPLPLLTRADKSLNFSKNNLIVVSNVKSLKADLLGEVQWERNNNLLLPKIKLRLINQNAERVFLYYRYKSTTYLSQSHDKRDFLDIDISLLDTQKIEVLESDRVLGEVYVKTVITNSAEPNILMDFSCSGYGLQVSGLEGHFVTVGCELERKFFEGKIIPELKVFWSSNEYRMLDKSLGPYQIIFTEGREAKFLVSNSAGEVKEVLFQVNFPERLHRLKFAAGLGPYLYQTSRSNSTGPSEILPSIMLYGNYYLNNIHSLRFFEALVMKESIFNHAGTYIGSQLGKFYDDRLIVSSLIGLQGLSYRFDSRDDLYTQIIYPQGLEIAFHHPFGLENYRFVVGGFLSPQPSVKYQNFWLRFGSKYFWEFNYINWGHQGRSASMMGLSIGFPIGEFF